MPTPPLNELLGQREEFNLNEVSGNSGQLASLEQRAREFAKLYALMQLVEGPGCERWANPGGFRLKDTPQWVEFYCLVKDMQQNFAITAAITAALSAQPREVVCSMCNGRGEIGGFINADSGYQTDPCPDCAAPQPREVLGVDDSVRRFLKSPDLYELLMNIQNGISSPADASMANSLIQRLDKIRDSLVATTPQDAAGVDTAVTIEQLSNNAPLQHSERDDAKQAYTLTAFDYIRAPVGTHDWQLYWRGWWHRSQLYTTPPPGVDVGKLRAAADELAAWFRSGNSVPVDLSHLFRTKWPKLKDDIDRLLAIIDAAAPGVQP